MELKTVTKPKDSTHEKGGEVQRTLYITDDFGGSVKLVDEQIGKLFKHIKPPLYG